MPVYRRYPAVVCATPFGVPVDPDVYRMKSKSCVAAGVGEKKKKLTAEVLNITANNILHTTSKYAVPENVGKVPGVHKKGNKPER